MTVDAVSGQTKTETETGSGRAVLVHVAEQTGGTTNAPKALVTISRNCEVLTEVPITAFADGPLPVDVDLDGSKVVFAVRLDSTDSNAAFAVAFGVV
jgi:hypothetical protein